MSDRAINLINKSNNSQKSNLTTKINVEFIRKNKTFNKNIYIIINDNMKKNVILPDNTQYFGDSNYEYISPQHKGMKLFVLLCYNQKYNKILIFLFALIYNENKETLEEIFKFPKLNYPKLITLDFGKARYIATKNIFPKARIYPCYFHLVKRFIKHIKYLNSNNDVLKRSAKNLLFNMKIIIFIDTHQIDEYF